MSTRTRPIFMNFAGGELSPSLEGRIDMKRYYDAVHEMRNWICKPQGGAIARWGTRFVAEVKDSDRETRLLPFTYSELQNYMIETSGDDDSGYMRFFMDGGQIMVVSGADLVTNGDFGADIANWDDLSTGTGSIAWNAGEHMDIDGGADGIGWTEQELTTVVGSIYMLVFDVAGNPLQVRIGTTTGADDLYQDTTYAVATGQIVFFQADSTSSFIQFRNANDNTSELDNVVCKLAIPYEIETPYLESEIWDLRTAQDDENLYIVHGDHPPMVLTRTDHDAWTLTEIEFIDGPYEDEINTPTVTPDWEGPSDEKVTNGGFDADSGWTKGGNWTISGGTANKSAGGANNLSQDTTEANGEHYMVTWTLVSISGGSLTMSIGGTAGAAKSAPGTFTEFITATGVTDLTFTPSAAGVACSIDNVSVVRLSVVAAASNLWQSGHVGALWRIKHSTDDWGWGRIVKFNSEKEVEMLVESAFGATTASTGHREGAWSEVNGWPRAVCFREGRIMYASSVEWPNTIWASKSGNENYNVFTPGTLDDDPFTYTLSDVNIIRWMESARLLCVGALSGEVTLEGSSDSPITPTTPPKIQLHTTHGSASIGVLKVGKAILFLQKAERKIREFAYVYEDDAYSAPDLTALSEHLMESGIINMAYQQEPHSIVWAVNYDGDLLGCTYDRANNIIGWHHHHTDGYFECVSTIPYQNEDQVWVIVQRLIDDDPKRYVEYLDPDIRVDCGVVYSGNATTLLRGLSHLEGKSVEIVGDGAPYPPQVVPSNGRITIDPSLEVAYVGLGYTPRMITNRPEVELGGTSQGLRKRWAKIMARVIDTSGLKINDELVPPRSTSDLLGTAPAPYTGDVEVTNLGWDTDGRIKIEQSLPLPAEVVCITGSLFVGDI